MTERQMEDALYELFETIANAADGSDECDMAPIELVDGKIGIESVATFGEVGMLTGNKGLVLRMRDGSRFQLTLVQAAGGEEDDENE